MTDFQLERIGSEFRHLKDDSRIDEYTRQCCIMAIRHAMIAASPKWQKEYRDLDKKLYELCGFDYGNRIERDFS